MLRWGCALGLCGLALSPTRLLADLNGPVITVRADQAGPPPTQIGVFFEDINYGADGGLYPERVKNRSFEFNDPWMGWKRLDAGSGSGVEIRTEDPLNGTNPHYARLANPSGSGSAGIANEGFFGIAVQKGAAFTFAVQGRSPATKPPALRVDVVGADGALLGSTSLRGFGREWKRHASSMRVTGTDPKATLQLHLVGEGVLDVDMVSLFPRDTWKHRANGLRPDLVQLLADLKPAFMRFPGGCIVEGHTLAGRYQWKTTIGAVDARKLIINRWNDEFKHRPAPDYFQSFGLGFFEYFQLCEDIGAAPLPILNCGMACQFNSGELAPMDQLDPYIQDALDLIEFANGPITSPWGARRAALGHEAPFGMKLLGVGNEQWGPQYVERYAQFHRALKERHPEIQLIASSGPGPADDRFRYLWPKLRELGADIIDEHCYDRPPWFLDNARRYDEYDRRGPKVFMGEYAAQSDKTVSAANRNNWECALSEAAYLTGLERNAEVVTMASYAPLFGHETGWQWRPNLIWMDNLRAYGTPNYYVQQLFSVYRGEGTLPVRITGQAPATSRQPGLYASASGGRKGGRLVIKIVNSAPTPMAARINIEGTASVGSRAERVQLSGAPADENSLEQPTKVTPRTDWIRVPGPVFPVTCAPHSFTVLVLRTGQLGKL
jgi:alpha-L-arabinofuranosidase